MLQVKLVKFSFFTIILLIQYNCFGQLHAGFTLDKSMGCSPLFVSFTDNTSGASSSAVYSWDFGNGNSSSLKNPGAVFTLEKTYTVTLTVTDSNKTSVSTQTVTVYSKPPVDFSASLQKGCAPLAVTFTGNDLPGNGTASYFWDYGDGNTESAATNQITHTYVTKQQPAVSLTITDEHGCQSSILKQNLVTILPTIISSFTADKTVLCDLSDPVHFINNSSGPGTLSYKWDFGDGTMSSVAQPLHVFTKAGIYTISLTVNSSDGCTVTNIQSNLVNVAGFNSDVILPAPVCNSNNTFINNSNPIPDNSLWEFSDGSTFNTFGSQSVYHDFTTPGTYTLKLTNSFGACKNVTTRSFIVNQSPVLNGFLVDITSPCGSPVKVNFNDTSSAAVKWKWTSSEYSDLESDQQSCSYTFLYDNTYSVYLAVTNAAGCTSNTSKQLDIYKPNVSVTTPEDYYGNGVTSCGPKNVHLVVTSSQPIKTYLWDLGDGTTSTEVAPVHLYSSAGNYYVHLKYTTVNGCSGIADLYYPIAIRDNIKANFTTANTNICGNTPVTFVNLTPSADYYSYEWDFGDNQTAVSYYNSDHNAIHQYEQAGTFTVGLIITNGICADTIVKKDFIKISPPFPKISGYTNTCDGNRGEVTFTQASTQVVSGTWNFGDGSTAPYIDQPQIKHTYTATGFYHVVLTTNNGSCTVGDSIYVRVLLKQHPVLTGDKKVVCSVDDYLQLTYSNLEVNPSGNYNYASGYAPEGWDHKDGSYAIGQADRLDNVPTSINISVWDFTPGDSLRSYVRSYDFGCLDTTNYIPLTLKGPIPGFKQDNLSPCGHSNTVTLEDTSKSQFGVALVSWKWDFGDGYGDTYTHGGKITHTYNYPGMYPVYLTVTDAGGCHAFFQGYVNTTSNPLTASFNSSSNTISPGTTVSFTNTSQSSDPDNTTYLWLFGDGTRVTSTDAGKKFVTPGTYTVELIATNTITGCMDTSIQSIIVKYINAAFTITSSYISNSKCPPVLVSFTNTSSNVIKITWDFGDGSTANDVFNPTHVYTKAGFYKIKVVTYSDNGTAYTTDDSIIITEPLAKVTADNLHSCTAQSVTLTSHGQNTSAYIWDFGDGTITKTTDSFSIHYYQKAGIYAPHIVAMDNDGCSASADLTDSIIIDSLAVSLTNVPAKICAPRQVFFNPDITSISAEQGQQNLMYHWNFGTGLINDTSNVKSPSFAYITPGTYPVSLIVRSSYGCVKEVQTTISAFQGLGARISGPSEICQNATAQFAGSTLLAGQPKWKWLFSDGTTALQQNPPPKEFDAPGSFPVTLLVDNNNCIDTVMQFLQVHAKPVANISPAHSFVCEGSGGSLIATGGGTYSWTPAASLNNATGSTVIASPLVNTTYIVTVTNSFGCITKDSADISVVHPFTMQAEAVENVCLGMGITLSVSGADTYQWIGNTNGLSNTAIANPVAKPAATTIYTVNGTDANKCFTDTANIQVTVYQLPVVNAGESSVIPAGTSYHLQPVISADVVKWEWSPSQNLSCSDCVTPVATPDADAIYTLTVTNAAGCAASDTVSVKLLCSDTRIYIPDAFTPNGDGLNDRFSILGAGVRIVHYLRIYNQWGALVFEQDNFQPGDIKGSWDGRYKGNLVSQGVYVYITEMSCNEHTFTKKGSVTVLY